MLQNLGGARVDNLQPQPETPRTLQTIFFDAAGTLFRLTGSVGQHYARVGAGIGLHWDAAALDTAFRRVWSDMPERPATGLPRADDDKGWWRALVGRVIDEVAADTRELDRDNFFEIAYEHFAEAGVWELFPEVIDVLTQLEPHFRLAVLSNFDGRLRMILGHLGLAKFFRHVCVSSELGADKPSAIIFRRALEITDLAASEALHVGDDPARDWRGARAAGWQAFELDRPRNSLRELLRDRWVSARAGLRGGVD